VAAMKAGCRDEYAADKAVNIFGVSATGNKDVITYAHTWPR
jgi:hypothetical protein